MKKTFLNTVLVLVLLMSLLCTTIIVSADGNVSDTQSEAKLVYAQLDSSWTAPNVHAFNSDTGNSCFGSWPGKAMTKDENNEGWYYIYISNDCDMAIINATVTDEDGVNASVQTVGLTITSDSWVTVLDTKDDDGNYNGTVSTEKATDGENPVYVATINVKAYVKVEWEDVQITASEASVEVVDSQMVLGSDFWYLTSDVPRTVDSIVLDDGNALNVPSVAIDANKLTDDFIPTIYVVVSCDADVYTAEVSYDEMPDVLPKLAIYAHIPDSWVIPCVWAWSHPDGTNAFANWPGAEMEKFDDNWYVMQVPNFVNKVIISGNLGDVQTVDMDLECKDAWIVLSETANDEGKFTGTITYEEPDLGGTEDSSSVPTDSTSVSSSVVVSGCLATIDGMSSDLVLICLMVLASAVLVLHNKRRLSK